MLFDSPSSVLLVGVLGLLIVAFAILRMAILERRPGNPAVGEPHERPFFGYGV